MQGDAASIALGQDAEAVVFIFMNPAGSGRRLLGGAGKAGLEALQLALQLTRPDMGTTPK